MPVKSLLPSQNRLGERGKLPEHQVGVAPIKFFSLINAYHTAETRGAARRRPKPRGRDGMGWMAWVRPVGERFEWDGTGWRYGIDLS